MVSGLPDFWRKYFFAGQDEGVWGIMPWAARAGYYRGIVLYGPIVKDDYWHQSVITVPSGKTFYLALFVIGSKDSTAVYELFLKDDAGVYYFHSNVHQGVVVPYNPPIPIPGGRTLDIWTYGYNIDTDYFATVIGFLY